MSNKDLNKGIDIPFADGKVRSVRPLTIRQLRKFMAIASTMTVKDDGSMNDDDIDKMVESAAIALTATDPDLAGDKDKLEDVLDLKSYSLLMAAAMGNDPN